MLQQKKVETYGLDTLLLTVLACSRTSSVISAVQLLGFRVFVQGATPDPAQEAIYSRLLNVGVSQ